MTEPPITRALRCIYCRLRITAKYPYRLRDGTAIHPRCKQTWEEETNRLMHQRGDFER
jgi:hypothetical protein